MAGETSEKDVSLLLKRCSVRFPVRKSVRFSIRLRNCAAWRPPVTANSGTPLAMQIEREQEGRLGWAAGVDRGGGVYGDEPVVRADFGGGEAAVDRGSGAVFSILI